MRMITFKPRRLNAGVTLYGALRNQLAFFSLLILSWIIGGFAKCAKSGSLGADFFIRDSLVFLFVGLAVLSVLWGITVKRVGRAEFGKMGFMAALLIPLDVVLLFALLQKILFL